MKNLVKASILAICMSATSVWATDLPIHVKFGGPAIQMANVIRSFAAHQCFSQVEHSYRASFSIDDIVNDNDTYTVKGTLIEGGDMIIGEATFKITVNYFLEWGPTYNCQLINAHGYK